MNATIIAILEKFQCTRRSYIVLCLVSIVIPLALGLLWGINGSVDSVYLTLHNARAIASQDTLSVVHPQRTSPLYVVAFVLPAIFRVSLLWLALIASTLGWGVTALLMHYWDQKAHRSVASIASVLLLLFSPMMISTLGTEIAWAVACVFLALIATAERRWSLQMLALALLLLLHLDLGTLALALGLLFIQWRRAARFPIVGSLVLAGAVFVWRVWSGAQIITAFLPAITPNVWWVTLSELFTESAFYWFFIPFIVIGLFSLPKPTLRIGIVWATILFLSDTVMAWSLLGTLGVYLTGLGIDVLYAWFSKKFVVDVKVLPLAFVFIVVVGLPLGGAQFTTLVHRIEMRPVIHRGLERQAAAWLRVHSAPGDAVFGTARVGYLAQRNMLNWEGLEDDASVFYQAEQILRDTLPEYCVSFNSLVWGRLSRTGWFRNTYMTVADFSSPYATTSPVTIWKQRPHTFSVGEAYNPISVRLPDGRYWIGYAYEPDRFQPGESISVTLFLHEPRPSVEPLQSVIFLNVPEERTKLAVQDHVISRDIVFEDADLGRVVAERFVLRAPDDLAQRAYHISAAIQSHNPERFAMIFHGESTFAKDRVALGYVAVPWQGSLDAMLSSDANIGDQITLIGYDITGELSPEDVLNVNLYWEARQSLANSEATYFVFVHVLDAEGQLVAQHDGPPVGGHYPHQAWKPGEIVRDVHPVALDAQLPPGMYRLQVGMYQRATMERLPVWDEQGNALADGVIVLQSLEIK